MSQKIRRDPGSDGRLLGVDLIRAVALWCMALAHAVPLLQVDSPAWGFVLHQVNDLASPTFALTMGLGLALVRARTGNPCGVVASNLLRGLFLLLLGIGLDALDSWIAIVLQPLGLTLMIGAFAVLIANRGAVLLLAVLSAAVAPILNAAAAQVDLSARPLAVLWHWFFLHPSYRVSNLLPLLLLGLWFGRRGACSVRLLSAGAILGIGLWVAGTQLGSVLSGPVLGRRSGSLPDMFLDSGLALLTTGICGLWALGVGSARPALRVWTVEIARLGTIALSFYCAQVAAGGVAGSAAGTARVGCGSGGLRSGWSYCCLPPVGVGAASRHRTGRAGLRPAPAGAARSYIADRGPGWTGRPRCGTPAKMSTFGLQFNLQVGWPWATRGRT